MFRPLAVGLICSSAVLFSNTAAACAWSLDSDSARLAFASVKNEHIAEVHRFTEINGSWAGSRVTIEIPISGLDTVIPIRNERMAEHLFKAAEYPQITVTANLAPAQLESLQRGDSHIIDLMLSLEIAGQRGQLPATVQITKVSDNRLLATTVQPIMIDSKSFGLTAGIDKLREIAGLQSIDLVVPVTFSVAFSKPS
jgi:hypothetical protein